MDGWYWDVMNGWMVRDVMNGWMVPGCDEWMDGWYRDVMNGWMVPGCDEWMDGTGM